MKILYHHKTMTSSGGMERVLSAKMKWLSNHGHQVVLVTTDDCGKEPFFNIPYGVRHIDLNIGYQDCRKRSFLHKGLRFLILMHHHRKRFRKLLMDEHPDVTIALYPIISGFIPGIKDGSKKILEAHFSRFFRLNTGRKGLTAIFDRLRTLHDRHVASRFDHFVILTNEDKPLWGNMPNLTIIPNPLTSTPPSSFPYDCIPNKKSHSVIAVGRLVYQKGFDYLLYAWSFVKQSSDAKTWTLDIYGDGPLKKNLEQLALSLNISDSVNFHGLCKNIMPHYRNAEFHVLSSRYEGMPLTIIEAMQSAIPTVAFACQAGPRDLISNGISGLLVSPGDSIALSAAMLHLIKNPNLIDSMGKCAVIRAEKLDINKIMPLWMELFDK